jgi:hypothetical protein
MFPRLLVSAAVGVAMAGTTFESAYRGMRHASPYEDSHRAAFYGIMSIKEELEKHHKERGRYPGSLADLKGDLPEFLQPKSSGQIPDPWKHPYEYRSDGISYTLRSLGLDGKPGGPGLAADLDAREVVSRDGGYEFPYHRRFRPTFRQYAFDLDTTRPVKVVCTLAGVFAAVACFVALRDRGISLVGMLGRLFLTLMMCFFITSVITVLHTPSHH